MSASPARPPSASSATPPRPASAARKTAAATTTRPSKRPSSRPRSASARMRPRPPAKQAPRPVLEADEEEAPRTTRRGGVIRPAVAAKPVRPTVEKSRRRLTVVTALSADEVRERSVASFRRRVQRMAGHRDTEPKEKLVREVTIPETITIQELANRMAERGVRRDPAAHAAGPDGEDHRRDRCRYGAAVGRGDGPHRQAGGRIRRRGGPVRRQRRPGRAGAAPAGRHHHGPCRPRQDVAARRHPLDRGGGRRSRRHHPAYRRLSGDRAVGPQDHLHRYAGPRRVHRHAGARRQGDRRGGAGGGGRRRRDAADRRGDPSRQGRQGADHRRHQQDRQAGRQAGSGAHRAAAARDPGRVARRRGARRGGVGHQEAQSRQAPGDARPAGGIARPQGRSRTGRPKAP